MRVANCCKGVNLEDSWKKELQNEFQLSYMQSLKKFIKQEKSNKKIIYPKGEDIFKAFELTPLDEVKVVILGQDPYHGQGQAHGLCFSVKPEVTIPPSLVNIYKELKSDVGISPPPHGCLVDWARQGVLLLNSVLTVEKGSAASHQGKGWEQFTDQVISVLNDQIRPIVFVLWGAYAQKKGKVINNKKHLIIQSAHPSPLSVYRGFYGSRPFSKINNFLIKTNQTPIDWQLSLSVEID